MTLLALGCSCSPAVSQKTAESGQPSDLPGSVWVVDDAKTGGRLFLCGTIHILRSADYPLSPAYEAAYANSDRLVFELPPGAGDGPAMNTRIQELGTYPPGESLDQDVAESTWNQVKEWGKTRGMTEAGLRRLRPWLVALYITSSEYAALGALPKWGVDEHFEQRAKKDGKPGMGLETVEFQLQLFARLTPAQQEEMLVQTLEEVRTLPQEFEKMIAAWKGGELDELGELLFREQAKFPDLMDLFLYSRNETWLPQLEALLKSGEKAMVLVGTGHFAAERGLIPLLKKRGYRVRHYRDIKKL